MRPPLLRGSAWVAALCLLASGSAQRTLSLDRSRSTFRILHLSDAHLHPTGPCLSVDTLSLREYGA